MMSEIEFDESQNPATNIENLTKLSRVCGSLRKRKSKAHYPLAPYRNELISLFKIDNQYDDERIHQNRLCNSCRSKCLYFRTETIFNQNPCEATVHIPHIKLHNMPQDSRKNFCT
jgi:hypothetical protein